MRKRRYTTEREFVPHQEEFEIEQGILSLSGVSDVKWEYGNLKKVNFINFAKDGLWFKIRIPRRAVPNIPRGISNNEGRWEVDANNKFYELQDVIIAVENVCVLQSRLGAIQAELKELAVNDSRFKPVDDEDVYNLTEELVKKYFNEKQVEDDKHGSIHCVIKGLGYNVLDDIYMELEKLNE